MSKKRDLPAGIYPHWNKFKCEIPGKPTIYVGVFDDVETAITQQNIARELHNRPKRKVGRPKGSIVKKQI